jgi:hypothetical protein
MNCRFFAHTAMMMLVLTGTAEAQEAYLDVILPHGAGRPTPSGDALAVPHSSSDSWNIGCRITGGLYGQTSLRTGIWSGGTSVRVRRSETTTDTPSGTPLLPMTTSSPSPFIQTG